MKAFSLVILFLGLSVQASPLHSTGASAIINQDYCICKEGVSDTVKHCADFCSSRPGRFPTLYASVTFDSNVWFHRDDLGNFENLHEWCTDGTKDSHGRDHHHCLLEVRSGREFDLLSMTVFPDSNNFKVDVGTLAYGTMYLANIIRLGSDSNVKSSSFRIYRKAYNEEFLRVASIDQYACINRSGVEVDGEFFYDESALFHYYYISGRGSPSLPLGTKHVVCHDTSVYGSNDSPNFPRLRLRERSFSLWDPSDVRFSDSDQDFRPDINPEIERRLEALMGEKYFFDTFHRFSWPSGPMVEGMGVNQLDLGFYMQPWFANETNVASCPTQKDYSRGDVVFTVLGDLLGKVDTEGLYLALSDLRPFRSSYVQDMMVIREGLLKKIWFYYENERHNVPDDGIVESKRIQFHWPPDVEHPFVKKSDQQVYTVHHFHEIQGVRPQNELVLAHDKRFGCIPVKE